jgi:hypothetical protein
MNDVNRRERDSYMYKKPTTEVEEAPLLLFNEIWRAMLHRLGAVH